MEYKDCFEILDMKISEIISICEDTKDCKICPLRIFCDMNFGTPPDKFTSYAGVEAEAENKKDLLDWHYIAIWYNKIKRSDKIMICPNCGSKNVSV